MTASAFRLLGMVIIVGWSAAMIGVLTLPCLLDSPSRGDDLTRGPVRVALLFYAIAATSMLLLESREWRADAGRGPIARLGWTLAWAAYVVHVGMAFHHYHAWSHQAAIEHTRAVSGFGEGIYFSHLFTLLWTVDVLWWWIRPRTYAERSQWIDRLLHAYMAFVIFNATVVFETGLVRWLGAILFVELAGVWAYRLWTQPAHGGKVASSS